MTATVWTDAKRAELARLRASPEGRGASARWFAGALGMNPSTVYAEMKRQDAAPARQRLPLGVEKARTCRCGARVVNEWWSDFRRCEPCRNVAALPPRFSDGVGAAS